MKVTSKRKELVKQDSLANNTREITHQVTSDARASLTIEKKFERIERVLLYRPGFARETNIQIIFACILRELLILRCVSKGFYEIITKKTEHSKTPSLLMDKAAISFEYAQLCDETNKFPEEKFAFFKDETIGMSIVVTVADFAILEQKLDSINQDRRAIIQERIKEDQLKLTLKIKELSEIAHLMQLLPDHPKFIDKIKELDLGELKINKDTVVTTINQLLVFIEETKFLSSLKSLKFGDIENKTILSLTNTIGPSITSLSIRNIDFDSSCIIPDSFFNLESISISGLINNSESIFSFFTKNRDDLLTLPTFLPNLVQFNIDTIAPSVIFNLPALEKLEIFFVGEIKGKLNMPDLLPNLLNFETKHVGIKGELNLYEMPKLFKLTIGDTSGKVTMHKSLPSLNLSIGDIGNDADINVSEHPNLQNLQIGNVGTGSFLSRQPVKLPTLLPDLVTCKIGKIASSITFNLPTLHKLEILSIGEINGEVNTPPFLPQLQHLEVDRLGILFTQKKHRLFANLRSLIIHSTGKKENENKDDYSFNFALPNLKELHIEIVNDLICLEGALPNLIKFSIGAVKRTLDLNDLTKLKSFSIQTLCLYTVDEDDDEKFQSVVSLPYSLDSLEELNINGHEAVLCQPSQKGPKAFVFRTWPDKMADSLVEKINRTLKRPWY